MRSHAARVRILGCVPSARALGFDVTYAAIWNGREAPPRVGFLPMYAPGADRIRINVLRHLRLDGDTITEVNT